MTSKIIVNNIGSDTGINTVTFDSNLQRGTSNLHSTGLNVSDTFLHSTGLNVGTGATIHQPADNVMTLGTNGSERLRIESGGDLKISNDIKSSDDDFYVYSFKGGSDGQVRSGIQYDGTNQRLEFFTGTTEKLRIASSGQIGIAGANYGTAGQVLTSQGSGSAAAWSTIASGLFSSYAIICDGNKSSGTHGGQPPNTSSYNKRDLNTEIADPDGIVSISNNEFTLQAGSYYIHAAAPGHRMNQHQARLTNATDGSVVQYGMSVHSSDGNSGNSIAHVYARVTIGSAKAFKIEHRCTNTDGEGFGLANNFGNNQIYTIVEIFKEN